MRHLLLFLLLTMLSTPLPGQEFKYSAVNQTDREVIMADLKETTDTAFLRYWEMINRDSVNCFRIYHTSLRTQSEYTFKKNPLPFLKPDIESIWFSVTTPSGDSIIAVAEKFQGRYRGLYPTMQGEEREFRPINQWLREHQVSLADKTLFYLSGNTGWHLITAGNVFVLHKNKMIPFNIYYKRKYFSLVGFLESF